MRNTEKRIYRLSAVCAILAAASFIVPRLVPELEGAFLAGVSRVMVLLAMLAATLLFSAYLLVETIREYRNIPAMTRIAGIGPAAILLAALLALLGGLRY